MAIIELLTLFVEVRISLKNIVKHCFEYGVCPVFLFCVIFTAFHNFYSVQRTKATKKVTKFGDLLFLIVEYLLEILPT